ncbi:MAG: hypothetical protein DCF22_04535 [Leptolyngbya sp.]|nr:MAG: hypothetical protein DCF22_04535 [Leptolyngbya sp.]
MVRKRLSDMLREEAQKPVETESAPASTAQVDATSNTTQSKPASKRRSTTTGSQTAATPPSSASKDTVSKEKVTAIAVEVTSLKAELETAAKQITDLNQQVADLKAGLEDQITASKKLHPTLAKAEKRNQQLEIELSEAKQTILQLVEVNSQLKQDLAVKQQAVAIPETNLRGVAAPPKKSLPEPSPIVPAEPKKSTLASATSTHQEFLRRQQQSLAHPVFPAGNSPGHLSDQDLGWVD